MFAFKTFQRKIKIKWSGCTNSNQLYSSKKKKKNQKSIIVFSFVFFSHSFLSLNKNNDKARINFPTHFMSNVELVKQKVQKYNFYNNFETFNSFSGCVWQQWSLNIALFLFSIASKSWAPCEHRPLATLYMITPFIIIYICAPLNTILSNSLCIIHHIHQNSNT